MTTLRLAPATTVASVALVPMRARGSLEGEAVVRQLLVGELALDGRLQVELLDEVGLLPDQLAHPARKLLVGGLARLEQVERAPALPRGVRDPGLEAQAVDLGERVDGLVAEVPPQLLDRGLRVGEVPEHDPYDHARSTSPWRASPSPA